MESDRQDLSNGAGQKLMRSRGARGARFEGRLGATARTGCQRRFESPPDRFGLVTRMKPLEQRSPPGPGPEVHTMEAA